MKKNPALTLSVVMLIVASFVLAGVASAELNLLSPLNAWDTESLKWENGNANLWFDPTIWTYFHEKLDFDSNEFDTSAYPECPAGDKLTPWAGELEIGLYHLDNNPAGAQGFQETRNWTLVDCDIPVDPGDPGAIPPIAPHPVPSPITGAVLTLVGAADQPSAANCGGNCAEEIINRYFVNLDPNCDGTPDITIPPAGICLYWEAQTPDTAAPDFIAWGGNFQARINSGGGDKTLNFKLFGPTAIALRSFQAAAVAPQGLALAAILGGLSAAGLLLRRRRS